MTALRDLFNSKKFQTLIIGLMLAAGARFGLQLDNETCAAILGLVGILIHAQGQADHGKEAAKIAANAAAGPLPVLALVVLALGASSQLGCAALKSSAAAAKADLYGCAKAEPKKLIAQFGPTMIETVKAKLDGSGRLDVDALRPVAAALETDASRCVLTSAIDFVAHIGAPAPGSPQSSAMPVDVASLSAGYQQLDAELWGGKTYELGGTQ